MVAIELREQLQRFRVESADSSSVLAPLKDVLAAVYGKGKRNVVCLNAPQAAHCNLIMALHAADGDTVHWWFVQAKRYVGKTTLTVRDVFVELEKMGHTGFLPMLAAFVDSADAVTAKAVFPAAMTKIQSDRHVSQWRHALWQALSKTESSSSTAAALNATIAAKQIEKPTEEPTARLLQTYQKKAQVHFAVLSSNLPNPTQDSDEGIMLRRFMDDNKDSVNLVHVDPNVVHPLLPIAVDLTSRSPATRTYQAKRSQRNFSSDTRVGRFSIPDEAFRLPR